MIAVGQSIGNYSIISKLGEGGMGTVFLAEHPVIGRKVAFKAIHAEFARDTAAISRFVNEAKAVNEIGHQHIVDVTDFGSTPDGDFYFIMEYLLGDTLSHSLSREGRYPPERAFRVAGQIADALQASHEHGVVHRDLKPDNVILIKRGDDADFVKVLDFGLATLTAVGGGLGGTDHGTVMGTPYYMAPEQCAGAAEIDHRADIYALGVILFELLTGKVPFAGADYAEILLQHLWTPAPSASSINPELSPVLDMILFRALSKDPGARFQSMAEMRQAFADPEGYAFSAPARVAEDDVTPGVSAATPMARTDVRIAGEPTQSGERMALKPESKTFDGSADLVESPTDEGSLRPKRSRGRAVVITVAAVAAVAVAGVRFRREATQFLDAALSPPAPTLTRLSFRSDPEGATVTQADGTILGLTPLSTDVPFGETELNFVISREGYLAKNVAAVPNVPVALSATLEHEPGAGRAVEVPPQEAVAVPEAPPQQAVAVPEAPPQQAVEAPAEAPPRRSRIRGTRHPVPPSVPVVSHDVQRDDSMPLTPTDLNPAPSPQTTPDRQDAP